MADASPDASPSTDGAPIELIATALRRERSRAGMSLSAVAQRAGVAKSTLSQLESGHGNPSVETLWALGVALGVSFSRLVEPATPPVRVVRAGEGPTLHSDQADYTGTLLSASPPSARRDLYVLRMEPGSRREADPHPPGSIEHVTVAAGRVRTGPDTDPVELAAGDYATFPGDVPHSYEALEPGSWVVHLMEHS